MSAQNDLKRFINKLSDLYKDAKKPEPLKLMGEEAVRIVTKRTRLGYSVNKNGEKSPLKSLSKPYVQFRKSSKLLSNLTTPSKSNLTFTGQMLDSMQVVKITSDSVIIGPRGYRDDGKANEQIANYVNKGGRPFNNLSIAEQSQIKRFYRKVFGDLVDRKF